MYLVEKLTKRKKMKENVNNARTRAQKQEAQNKHQLLNKEVKKCCRKDKREYVNDLATEAEFAAYKGDIKTLYNITKTLSRRKTAKSKPVKDKDGKVLTNLNEQMERWNEYFVNVLNRPEPDQPVIVEPAGVDLNIKIDNIKKYEVKKAIKSLKNGKSAGRKKRYQQNALDTTPRGIQWNFAQRLEDLDFADDLALLSHRLKDMRDKTTELHETGKKLGLKINIKKTKIMKVKTRKGGTVSIEGEDIEEVDQFTYLGSIMDRTGGTDADIRTRISKARQAFAMLKPVWKSTAFTENT
ncbi:unnamed protein product [Mytilus edulis]|uniref:Reverse transcriptase domain-containing protein n=1 Tax=Mytilus edulis TaxID=6550 RepID=A0A8S3PU85_MYTED|nr:unnamed protein product [Mytilus edulis]